MLTLCFRKRYPRLLLSNLLFFTRDLRIKATQFTNPATAETTSTDEFPKRRRTRRLWQPQNCVQPRANRLCDSIRRSFDRRSERCHYIISQRFWRETPWTWETVSESRTYWLRRYWGQWDMATTAMKDLVVIPLPPLNFITYDATRWWRWQNRSSRRIKWSKRQQVILKTRAFPKLSFGICRLSPTGAHSRRRRLFQRLGQEK